MDPGSAIAFPGSIAAYPNKHAPATSIEMAGEPADVLLCFSFNLLRRIDFSFRV